ncbi:MAG TPA: hypothetical protein VMQ11_08975 [Alphaproteobacteria bacterium]|nr:hypothetical protein [Alphaproteobacteria bacterium]
MVDRIMWAAALSLIQKHGNGAAAWAATQARELRAAGDIKGGVIFECLCQCVERLQSRARVVH